MNYNTQDNYLRLTDVLFFFEKYGKNNTINNYAKQFQAIFMSWMENEKIL